MNTKYAMGGLIMLLATMAGSADSNKPFRIAIWLVPAQGQQHQIQPVISALAEEHSNSAQYVPVFRAHATLCVGELENKNIAQGLHDLFAEVDSFSTNQKEIRLAVRTDKPIDQRTKQWSQFLFLALNSTGAPEEALDPGTAKHTFAAISRNLTVSTDSSKPQVPMLHLSLLYSGNEHSFDGIAEEVEAKYKEYLPDQLVFDTIQVVTPRSGDWRDILKEHPDVDGNWDVIYTKKLGPPAPSKPLRMVVAGGQTGVDQSAWRAARSNQLLIGGWCPPHRDIGFGKRVPDEFPCQVTPHDKFSGSQIERSERTRWNVHAAEATLVLRMPVAQGDQPKQPDRGTDFTIASARELGRPFLICDPTNSKEVDRVVRWIRANEVHTLNVGGPRDDAEHKISSVAEQFLSMVFAEVANAKQ